MITVLGSFGVCVPSYLENPFMSQLLFPLQLAGPISPDFLPTNPAQKCHEFDQGVGVVVQVLDSSGSPVGLRTATARTIFLLKPSGDRVTVPAQLFTNGYDGKMSFSTGVSLPLGAGLDQTGLWYLQGRITLSGNKQYTDWGCFLVASNLGA
jgi:hypothetical protein